jgi:hypothetical protein
MRKQKNGTGAGLSAAHEDLNTSDVRRNREARRAPTVRSADPVDPVQETAGWREQVGEHPFLAVGTAFVVGGLLSGLFRHKPTPRERMLDALADSFEAITHGVRNRVVSQLASGVSIRVLKTVGAALATKVAYAYWTKKVNGEPGFADQDQ